MQRVCSERLMGVLTVLVVGAFVSSCAPDGGQGSRVKIQTGIEKSNEVVEVKAYYFSAPESFSSPWCLSVPPPSPRPGAR